MGGRVVLVRARKLRPGMVLLTRDDVPCNVTIVRGGAVLLTDETGWRGWYRIWFLLDAMKGGRLMLHGGA